MRKYQFRKGSVLFKVIRFICRSLEFRFLFGVFRLFFLYFYIVLNINFEWCLEGFVYSGQNLGVFVSSVFVSEIFGFLSLLICEVFRLGRKYDRWRVVFYICRNKNRLLEFTFNQFMYFVSRFGIFRLKRVSFMNIIGFSYSWVGCSVCYCVGGLSLGKDKNRKVSSFVMFWMKLLSDFYFYEFVTNAK